MRRIRLVGPLLVLGVLTGSLAAQSARTEHTLRLDDSTRSPVASLADVAWLRGAWTGEAFGGTLQAGWMPPAAGNMVGVFKLIQDDEATFYEILWIVEQDSTLMLKLKHFSSDLTSWEEKSQHVSFPLVRIEDDVVYFSGLTFRRVGAHGMEVHLALRQAGEDREERLVYRRTSVWQ